MTTQGLIPRTERYVKNGLYVVQEGDSVSRIAHNMTGDASRWPELVGANLHRPLAPGAVGETPYRAFASLHKKEALLVPASWPVMSASGLVGDPAVDMLTQFTQAANTVLPAAWAQIQNPAVAATLPAVLPAVQQVLPNIASVIPAISGQFPTTPGSFPIPGISGALPALPTSISWNDVGAVMYYLSPYLPAAWNALLTGAGSGNPTAISAMNYLASALGQITPQQALALMQFASSAIAFLRTQQLPAGSVPNVLQNIPWNAVPWNQIPWAQLSQIGQSVGVGNLTGLFTGLLGTTPAVPQQRMSTKSLPSIHQSTIHQIDLSGAPSSGPTNGIDVSDPSTWQNPVFQQVAQFGLPNVPWNQIPVGNWANLDPATLACLQAHPERGTDVLSNPSCFASNTALVASYLCGTMTVAQACAANPTPPVNGSCGVGQISLPGGACVPNPVGTCGAGQMPTGTGGCVPMPTCPAGQFPNPFQAFACQVPPAACPDGSTFDPSKWACSTGTGTGGGATTKDNTGLYIGLGLGAAALVAVIAIMA